jgi:hypothetical protein
MFGQHEIKDVITQPPVIEREWKLQTPVGPRPGPYTKAWLLPVEEVAKRSDIPKDWAATVQIWLIEAPWAHPMWHSYILSLIHLRPIEGVKPPVIHLKGATHEMMLWALDPQADRRPLMDGTAIRMPFLSPANFAAQLTARTDEDACIRVRNAVQRIADGKLSPDTDYLRLWIRLFGDNMIKRATPIVGRSNAIH